jgi:hypothetical protein
MVVMLRSIRMVCLLTTSDCKRAPNDDLPASVTTR